MVNVINIAKKVQFNFLNQKPIYVLFCDIQDKYITNIYEYQNVIDTAADIAEASRILGLSQIVSLQKESVFGGLIKEVKQNLCEKSVLYEKTSFSMVGNKTEWLDKEAVYVLLGIEAHVCVTQTAIDLLSNDYDLVVLSDGVSSASKGDRKQAMKNLEKMGAYVTTSQSFLFLLLKDYTNPLFKPILPIFKRQNARENKLLNN